MDGVIGPLEQQGFAIHYKLDALIRVLRVEIVQTFPRQHDRCGDVVFYLYFIRRIEIRTQLVDAPGAVRVVSHAQIVCDQLLIFKFQLMAGEPVDAVHAEVLAPVFAPILPVISLHRDEKLPDGLRDSRKPFIVRIRVLWRRRHQLDHRTERPFRAQDRPFRAISRMWPLMHGREILLEDLRHLLDLPLVVTNEDGPLQDDAADRFRNLGFAAA